jgi:hypothetical protein
VGAGVGKFQPRHLTYVKDGIFGISKRPFNIGEIKSFTLVAMTEYTYIYLC